MKTFLTINIILLFLNACSYDNAFSRFELSQKKAKSEESIVSSKIYNDKEVLGIVSCVYLNVVNPKRYQDSEYFYIYIYLKDKSLTPTFVLNDINSSSVQKLYRENEFALLTSSKVAWQDYYLVKFPKQDGHLVFKVKLGAFSSDPSSFEKDE